ncbi:hypothetical protein [Hymenobacter sp. DG01]|uniref:hypothetical protein n=1 Tax=Hymenobacter sp. DG01 TaxID=2584940 RepID=UPI001C5D53A2|nr:hypothetical protein [Hymenobacter sp. DG01]
MKLTRLLLLPLLLSTSLLVQAQQGASSSKTGEGKVPKVEDVLRGSVNPRYKVLKDVTLVYRYQQPADTSINRPVLRLFPGTRVYIRDYKAQGFLIDFGSGELYYLPAKSVEGLPTHVEL